MAGGKLEVLNPNHGGRGKEVSLQRDETILSGEKVFCFPSFRERIRGFCDMFRQIVVETTVQN
jgi:hypothetical protein